ncbi:NUDIX domain-containing protein [Albimonas sp. CAU 1670]|uniref:NUDIX hydrolase n=1 Tax=Albimonas sp. CAU 1670 TaxID=3032599 RepID=UPI0023DC6324|nr:NUDIX domain-containing protein [Albimonas sp. CAU 1670]MDF2231818.1 NUDIX domain-containing protein [Albimonas sp. CAU 1670]
MPRWVSMFWSEVLRPMLRRPPRRQVAALCWRDGEAGPEVLLISSRGTGRWILPKGWPMRGKGLAAAAQQEAWEEAGVIFETGAPVSAGVFASRKVSDSGLAEPAEVEVFAARVRALADEYPELGQRTRRWASPAEAAGLVEEEGLARILRAFGAAQGDGRPGPAR